MKIRYQGPCDEIEILGQVCLRNHSIEIEDSIAGHPANPRVAPAMLELHEAITASDHNRAQELREELAGLDFGEGLLSQEVWVSVEKSKAPKEDDK